MKIKTKTIIDKIKYHKNEIAKHRDALRALLDETNSITDSCDDAIASLEYALDSLSEYL